MNNWCITDKVFLYFSWDNEYVSIANPESKKYWAPVQKNSLSSSKEPDIKNNTGFKIKIKNGKIYLEISNRLYEIKNLYMDDLISQFSESTITNGESTGVIFGFSQYVPDKVILVFPGSSLYKKCEDEFMRKTSLSVYKKTTKYTPGHRYETESGSFWYIGDYYSNRGDKNDYWVDKYSTNTNTKFHLFSNFLPDSKKFSEILEKTPIMKIDDIDNYSSCCFPKMLIFTSKSKSMVDSGLELDLDIELEDSYEKRFEYFMKNNKNEYTIESGRYYYTDLLLLLSIFDISSISLKKNLSMEKIKNYVTEIISKNTEYILFVYYGVSIDETLPEDQQIDKIITLYKKHFFGVFGNYTNNNFVYTINMLSKLLEIDIYTIFLNTLEKFKKIDKPDLLIFEDYINDIGYFQQRCPNYIKLVDFIYTNPNNRKISEFFKDSPIKTLMADIYKKAMETNGANLEIFEIENVGTARNPVLKYKFSVTLNDIKNHYGVDSLLKIPNEIKSDLMNLKIYRVDFVTKSDLKIYLT